MLVTMPSLELLEHEADIHPPEDIVLTEEEYLATEPERFERHEYIDGQLRAMAGAGDSHEGVALLLAVRLVQHLRGKPCRVYKGDMKLRIQQRTQARKVVFYYPDIMVVCDPADNGENFKTRPKMIVEVLSNDKGRDLIEKLAVYREIDSLEEYFVVSRNAQRPEVTVFRRRTDFAPEILQEGPFTMESIGMALTVKELYDY
jgi:Uma2 family endonuclease